MDKEFDQKVAALVGPYTKFFIEDVASMVLANLEGQTSVSEDKLAEFVASGVAALDIDSKIAQEGFNPTPASKFIYECAEYAAQQSGNDASSRETFDMVKTLPSVYHEEIDQFIEQSAKTFSQTLDKVVIGVLANDARNTAQLINRSAENRLTSTQTSADVNRFNWGILSDGLWLNAALLKAYDLAAIFGPDSKVVPQNAETAFSFARGYVTGKRLEDSDGTFNLMVSHLDDVTSQTLLGDIEQYSKIRDLLFRAGDMSIAMDSWEAGLRNPQMLVKSVEELTGLARLLPALRQAANALRNDDLISQDALDRIVDAENAVVLSLAAYEVVRETTYEKSLVMYVDGQGEDPSVSVYVNADNLNAYYNAGGEEADLTSLGTYLDPRKGMPQANGGYNVDWAVNRRIDIIADCMATESLRIDQLRSRDAFVIEQIVKEGVGNVVQSYALAAGQEAPSNNVLTRINGLARKMTEKLEDDSFSLESFTMQLLADTIDNPLISTMSNTFVDLVQKEEEHAKDLTIASAAMQEMVNVLFAKDEELAAA